MKMNQQIQGWIDELRTNPSENVMHRLIETGKDILPLLIAAWRAEDNLPTRNRFFEVLSEIPAEETLPLFRERLSSQDRDEARFAVLGLFRFDPVRDEAQILRAIQTHPILSLEKEFVDYVQNGLKAAKRRSSPIFL